jgi:hypothetical protein
VRKDLSNSTTEDRKDQCLNWLLKTYQENHKPNKTTHILETENGKEEIIEDTEGDSLKATVDN